LKFAFVEAMLLLMNVVRNPLPVPLIRPWTFVLLISISFENDCMGMR
jgi:hypothetical protein